MFNGFNFSNEDECNCPDCRMSNTEVDLTAIDLTIDDPEDVLNQYFADIKLVQSEEELFELLSDFMVDVSKNAIKEYLMNEMMDKIDALQAIELEDDI